MDGMQKGLKITNKTGLFLRDDNKTASVDCEDCVSWSTELTKLKTEADAENEEGVNPEEINECIDVEYRDEALDLQHVKEILKEVIT